MEGVISSAALWNKLDVCLFKTYYPSSALANRYRRVRAPRATNEVHFDHANAFPVSPDSQRAFMSAWSIHGCSITRNKDNWSLGVRQQDA